MLARFMYIYCFKDFLYLSLVVRKPVFRICENKDAGQLRGNRAADQRLFFRYTDSKSLFYLSPKFQASSHLVWLYRPGRKPRRPLFSQRGSFVFLVFFVLSSVPAVIVLFLSFAARLLRFYIIDKSIPRVTVWHHEAPPSNA